VAGVGLDCTEWCNTSDDPPNQWLPNPPTTISATRGPRHTDHIALQLPSKQAASKPKQANKAPLPASA
jgi:hypothetical protein